MEKCPPEILTRVFALACTDSGATGRALSLVSTRIHDISLPYKYFSLHVNGVLQLSQFSEIVQVHDPAVQYLMLDCATLVKQQGSETIVRNKPKGEEYNTICTHVYTILRVLAPKIKGLYLVPAGVPLKLSSLTFPLLDTFFLYDFPSDISILWSRPHFPSLKRLDVSCDMAEGLAHDDQFSQLQDLHLPALTHLGCCSHAWDRLKLNFFFASMANESGPNRYLKRLEWLFSLRSLTMLRVGLPKGQASVVGRNVQISASRDRSTKQIMELTNSMLFENCGAGSGGQVPMRQWDYVVTGGEGFERTADGYLVQRVI